MYVCRYDDRSTKTTRRTMHIDFRSMQCKFWWEKMRWIVQKLLCTKPSSLRVQIRSRNCSALVLLLSRLLQQKRLIPSSSLNIPFQIQILIDNPFFCKRKLSIMFAMFRYNIYHLSCFVIIIKRVNYLRCTS